MEQARQPQFRAENLYIRQRGARSRSRSWQGGSVTISDGRLVLRGPGGLGPHIGQGWQEGETIIEAPMTEVRALSPRIDAGASVWLWIGEEKYAFVEDWSKDWIFTTTVFRLISAFRSAALLKGRRELNASFLRAVEAAGGRVGKP